MENVFDSLCSALGEPEIKKTFLDLEGIDLMVLMLKFVVCIQQWIRVFLADFNWIQGEEAV